jgi:hypothetical protein
MGLRLPDLVGRVMTDPDFLAELLRAPEAILPQYELTEDERALVRAALARLAHTPVSRRAESLGVVLLRRVAT